VRDDLAAQEQVHVRTALRYLRCRSGRWAVLAKALGVDNDTIGRVLRGARPVTPRLAFRVARLARTSVDAVLAGRYVPAGTCPHCGHPPDEAAQ
jgi:plasmid maintenance system antidote protein VapI